MVAAEDFELATARDPGILGVELMAQVRPNGCIMDHFRLALGGSHIIKARFEAKEIFAYLDEIGQLSEADDAP